MLNELRQYNNIGDANGITFLLQLLLSDKKIQKISAEKLCSLKDNISLKFSIAVIFFEYLEIIEEKDGYLYRTETGESLIHSDQLEKELCRLCFLKSIKDELLDTDAVHYCLSGDEYIIEKYGFSISAALFRNILLQYHALVEHSGNLVISSEYENIFAEYQRKHRVGLSLERLKKQLESRNIQGEKAEQFVLKYEKKRLSTSPNIGKIKQISQIDVTAGFDILSFENSLSRELNRFIEVKSYIGSPHFHWSQNEIEKAKLYEDKYFIYLVDITQIDNLDYEPRIIQNPAKNILDNNEWILNPQSYLVIPTE